MAAAAAAGEDAGVGEGTAGCGDDVEGFGGGEGSGGVIADGAEGSAREELGVVWVGGCAVFGWGLAGGGFGCWFGFWWRWGEGLVWG